MRPELQQPRILVLTGGLIHLVHQLAVANTLLPAHGGPAPISIGITGVLRQQSEALASLHGEIQRWLRLLRQQQPETFGALQLMEQEEELEAGPWDWALLNSQWLVSQRQVVERLGIRQLVVCGDGLGVYYRLSLIHI